MGYVRKFIENVKAEGLVRSAAEKAGSEPSKSERNNNSPGRSPPQECGCECPALGHKRQLS